MPAKPKLTTTSYAILALLAVGDWTAHELILRMDRSLRFYWPRARSKLYEEPRKLVDAGLARTVSTRTRPRSRALYRITPAGRRALREWLAEPGGPPSLEWEGLLKVAFADHGDIESLRATLERAREDAVKEIEFGKTLAESFLDGLPTFTERLHIGQLVWYYLTSAAELRKSWADWALATVSTWEDTSPTPERIDQARQRLNRPDYRPFTTNPH